MYDIRILLAYVTVLSNITQCDITCDERQAIFATELVVRAAVCTAAWARGSSFEASATGAERESGAARLAALRPTSDVECISEIPITEPPVTPDDGEIGPDESARLAAWGSPRASTAGGAGSFGSVNRPVATSDRLRLVTSLVPCPECRVPQTIVTGTGVSRTHDRIGLSTGTNYGECPGSGTALVSEPRPVLESKPDTTKKPLLAPTHAHTCRVCRAKTTASRDGRISQHAWPDNDALCRASGLTRDWIPKNLEAGRPLITASSGEALTPAERKRYTPLVRQIRKKVKRRDERNPEAERRLRRRKAADRKWMQENGIRVFSGGAPGLGKRR